MFYCREKSLYIAWTCFRNVFVHIVSYNAASQNEREIVRVYNYRLYIATVNIKQMAVDRIETALRFWFAQRDEARKIDANTITCMTSVSTIVMECYVHRQTDRQTDKKR